ncbi:hypothetical protein SAMN02910358_01342 [Lachnospiraceae bacterium XBB1006]|nr:hypothetical protein SAMN02910358_01342 [Lachnospiraceae bacterium XBB1006]
MNNIYEREQNNYKNLNQVANANGVVLVGSTFAKEIPVCELRQTFQLDCDLYNRSYTDLSIYDAKDLIVECMDSLSPHKLLLNLGETDLERGFHTITEIVGAYETLIKELKQHAPYCQLVIVSVCDSDYATKPGALNRQLELMAKRNKCQFADISSAKASTSPCVKAFDILRFFMLDRLTLSDVILANA